MFLLNCPDAGYFLLIGRRCAAAIINGILNNSEPTCDVLIINLIVVIIHTCSAALLVTSSHSSLITPACRQGRSFSTLKILLEFKQCEAFESAQVIVVTL